MKKLTIGILAHVDSGKTTLSEALLYQTGAIRTLGRVDNRDAFLDTYSMERERGITIFSKQAQIQTESCTFTLIDTPGHVDFSPETERTLDILDYAILVISATAGVQSHTETLWKLLSRHKIPTFIFVNKTDLPNADTDACMRSFTKKLSSSCLDIDHLGSHEECALCSTKLMNEYLETGEISDKTICTEIANRNIVPVFFGSALKLSGIREFLYGLEKYTIAPYHRQEFGARIYKVTHDQSGNRLVHMKITGGTLKVRDEISGIDKNGNAWCEKINQIRIYSGDKYITSGSADAGTVCAVTGLSFANVSDRLGFEREQPCYSLQPVLSYKLVVPKGENIQSCLEMLRTIEDEEPTLHISFDEASRDINVLLMGEIQLEVLKNILYERFNFNAVFGEGTIVYRETISSTVEGVGHFEPLRHYAEVHLLLEPAERGSGLIFSTDCSENDLSKNWQRLVLTHLEEKIHKGVLTCSPITDMKITLVSGKAHKKHTEGGDFREATYRAVRQGLRKADSVLLEPFYSFEITVPTESVGRTLTDLQKFGAEFSAPDSDGQNSFITGKGPVSNLKYYSLEISSYTHGKGSIIYNLDGYYPCHNQEEVIALKGYDPDADIRNSCDSVFCANGSGFIVPWNEVENHMHLESVLEYSSDKAESQRELRRQAENYCAAVATDKELMEIFERTYGKIKAKEVPKVKLNPSAKSQKTRTFSPASYNGKDYLLIDGYNIIFAWDELKALARDSLEYARQALIDRMCNYQGFLQSEITIVFDAYKVKKNPGSVEKIKNINVVYTKEAETADTYIERVSKTLAKQYRVRVATSDGPEQMIILGNGALRVPAAALKKELNDAENAINQIIQNFS